MFLKFKKASELKTSLLGFFMIALVFMILFIQEEMDKKGEVVLSAETPAQNIFAEYYHLIVFKDNGEYLTLENTGFGNHYFRGNYTYKDSIFTLDKTNGKFMKYKNFKIMQGIVRIVNDTIADKSYYLQKLDDNLNPIENSEIELVISD